MKLWKLIFVRIIHFYRYIRPRHNKYVQANSLNLYIVTISGNDLTSVIFKCSFIINLTIPILCLLSKQFFFPLCPVLLQKRFKIGLTWNGIMHKRSICDYRQRPWAWPDDKCRLPSKEKNWHSCKRIFFKYLLVYLVVKPSALWRKGGEGIRVSFSLS